MVVGDTMAVRSVRDQLLLFTKHIVRTIVVNLSVNLRPSYSCRMANRKSTSSRFHLDNFANYCRCIEVLLSINVKAVCLLISSLTYFKRNRNVNS